MPELEVLKFGSSVLRSPQDLPLAVDEIYRCWRAGCRILVVVSAFEGVTDGLMAEVVDHFGSDCPEAVAAYVATGEQKTAALLLSMLRRSGLPSRTIDPREIQLMGEGEMLESTPVRVDQSVIERLWSRYPILVLPGFYGIDADGRIVLFGRGGSDLSALFLAAELGGKCRLLKNVRGVFNVDPARYSAAHRYSVLSWETAIEIAGPLIQSKALRYAQSRSLAFEVGRPNDPAATLVGCAEDQWAPPAEAAPLRPLRIALLGCGVVGRGVLDAVRRYPATFDVRHVLVRNVDSYSGIDHITADASVALDDSVEIVIVCIGGETLAHSLIRAALNAGKYVITANKAVIAAHGSTLAAYARGESRRLWYSAAVGGALPALETLSRLTSPVREIRGIINGTCGVVLDAWGAGKTRHDAVAMAQLRGFAEENPARDLSGRDSADKLALMINAAFGDWISPDDIPTNGIDSIAGDPKGYKLIARANRSPAGISASVGPELPPARSFLGQARGPENRLEIELSTGEVICLRGQGAGRWPTAASVLGDLHEVARLIELKGERFLPKMAVQTPITRPISRIIGG